MKSLSRAALPLEGGPCRNVTVNASESAEATQSVTLYELISFSEYQVTVLGRLGHGFPRVVSKYINTRTRKMINLMLFNFFNNRSNIT